MADTLYKFEDQTLPELPTYNGTLVTDTPSYIPSTVPQVDNSLDLATTFPSGGVQSYSTAPGRNESNQPSMPGEGFWPVALATLSALSGNFGPAITLTEQKRRTELEKTLRAPIADINSVMAKGDFAKAGEMTDDLISRVGGRSPEIATFLREQRKNILERQTTYNSFKNAVDYFKDVYPENDIRRPRIDAMSKLLARPSGITDKLVAHLISKMDDPHIQWINGVLRVTDPVTLNTIEKPGATMFEAPKGYVGEQLQADTGMTSDAITNFMNGKSVEVGGNVVESTPERRAALTQHIAKLQGIAAQLTYGQQIPMSPEQAQQYTVQGVSPLGIATRQGIQPGNAQAALQGSQQQGIALAQAGPLAQLQLNPAWAQQAGMAVVDTDANNFGRETAIPYNAMQASGGRFVPIRQKIMDDNIRPNITALGNLTEVNKMFKLLGLDDYSSPLDRAVTAVNRVFSSYTGITFRPEDTAAKVAEVVARRALEQLGKTGTVSEREMGTLKKYVTGIAANPKGAKMAIQEFQDTAQRELKLYIDKNKVDDFMSTLPGSTQGKVSSEQHEQVWLPLAQRWGVDPTLVRTVLSNEKSGDNSVSRSDAIGRFQVRVGTALPYLKALGKTEQDLFDPTVNAQVGLLHLAYLSDKYKGNVPQILAAYIGGEGAVNPDGSIKGERREKNLPNGKPGTSVAKYVADGMKTYQQNRAKVNYTFTGVGR